MTVVKADAYGHGLKQIAGLLMQSGTDVFGVANLAEAVSIRSVGRGWPILMLGASLPDEVEQAVADEVMPTISTIEEARWFSSAAIRQKRIVNLHLKIDTGMGRLGVEPEKTAALAKEILSLPGLKIQGIYTHYAAVEDDRAFSRHQARSFASLLQRLKRHGIDPELRHANNSGGLMHEPRAIYNLVRPGLMVYGIVPSGRRKVQGDLQHHLKPALSWKCRVSLVKTIKPGTSLSYGRAFIARRPMKVATLTVGYGDGYLRAGSNHAQVLVGGQRCRVLGRITMDQTLVNVSKVDNVMAGDEAVLIGSQNALTVTATELAAWCKTIPWEVLTAITYRVPRIYRGGQAA